MKNTSIKNQKRTRRHIRIRTKINGTMEKPRLSIYKSNTALYAQVIDDVSAKTLVSVSTKEINAVSIKEFANELNMHPGIVVGRLQHEKIIEHKEFNHLRAKYRFTNN